MKLRPGTEPSPAHCQRALAIRALPVPQSFGAFSVRVISITAGEMMGMRLFHHDRRHSKRSPDLEQGLLLHCPQLPGSPCFRVRLIVAVPVSGCSGRI